MEVGRNISEYVFGWLPGLVTKFAKAEFCSTAWRFINSDNCLRSSALHVILHVVPQQSRYKYQEKYRQCSSISYRIGIFKRTSFELYEEGKSWNVKCWMILLSCRMPITTGSHTPTFTNHSEFSFATPLLLNSSSEGSTNAQDSEPKPTVD